MYPVVLYASVQTFTPHFIGFAGLYCQNCRRPLNLIIDSSHVNCPSGTKQKFQQDRKTKQRKLNCQRESLTESVDKLCRTCFAIAEYFSTWSVSSNVLTHWGAPSFQLLLTVLNVAHRAAAPDQQDSCPSEVDGCHRRRRIL